MAADLILPAAPPEREAEVDAIFDSFFQAEGLRWD